MLLNRKYFFVIVILIAIILFISYRQTSHRSSKLSTDTIELYDKFDTINHILPLFDKKAFDTLHSWDFGWAILQSIDSASDKIKEVQLSRRFSPGQKALYFIWYLDAEVTNGGFIQFYWNGYRKYLPPIKEGLKVINDSLVFNLINAADKEFIANISDFEKQRKLDDWEPLYNNLKRFDYLDSLYYKYHDHTMDLIENYARQHPQEFVKFK